MERKYKVSIAMAVCNGEKYINPQIDSILSQLTEQDQLVISYDYSSDKTLEIIKDVESKNSNVHVYLNEDHSKGLVSNFENALMHCDNDIIFYSDQDDVWLDIKIDTVCQKFKESNVAVVIHDAVLVDADLKTIEESTFKIRGGSNSLIKNLIRLSYIGCCLAFRKSYLSVVLPIPNIPRAHDWWTGSICSCYGKMEIIRKSLILHRIHSNNATPKNRAKLSEQLRIRIILIWNLVKRKVKVRNIKVY